MKKCYFILFLVSLVMFSCQKEHLYSCDPFVDEWAVENYNEIMKLSSEEFYSLKNNAYRRAAYRIMPTQSKFNIWRNKLDELEKLEWSEEEWKHILKIYSLALSNTKYSILNTDHIEENDSLLIQIYRWENYAREELKWTKKMIYAICCTPEKMINKNGDLYYNINENVQTLSRTEGGFECSCSQVSSYCDILDHEGPDYTVCRTPTNGSCVTVSGCGFFWQFKCDGMCMGLYV